MFAESIEFTGEDARLFVEVSLLCVELNSVIKVVRLKKEVTDYCFFVAFLVILE